MDRKVIAITGGAQGQGRLHAIKFAENGYDVALADMQEPTSERFQETVRELNELGAQVLAMKADVTSAEEMEAFFTAIWDKFGRLDAVSYTHLDVYKRQGWSLPRGPAGPWVVKAGNLGAPDR